MNNLLSRNDYHASLHCDETGYWSRLPWITGVLFGAPMAIMVFIVVHEIKNFQKWFLRTMPRVLEIACKDKSNRFLVPQAERTCEKIKGILGKVEQDSASVC